MLAAQVRAALQVVAKNVQGLAAVAVSAGRARAMRDGVDAWSPIIAMRGMRRLCAGGTREGASSEAVSRMVAWYSLPT